MAGWLGSRDLGFSDRDPLKRAGNFVACVASVSVRFRSKERGTRVKDRAKNGSRLISHAIKPKIPFHGLFLLRNQTETLATQATIW